MEHVTITRAELPATIRRIAKAGRWHVLHVEGVHVKIYGTWAQIITRDGSGVRDSGPMDCTQKACVAAIEAAFSWPVEAAV